MRGLPGDLSLSRRQAFGLALSLTGTAALAACGARATTTAPGTTQKPAAQPAAPKPKTPAISGTLDWLVRTNAVEQPWENDVVLPKMREKFPNLKINMLVTAGKVWNEKTFELYAAGTPPDVHNGIVGTFILLYAEGKVLALDPLLKRDKFSLEPFQGLTSDPDMCRSGKQWGLPILTTLGTMINCNANKFEEAGVPLPPTSWQDKSWTWDRLVEIARKMTKNWGKEDASYGFYRGWMGQYHVWAYPWGGDPFPKEWYAQGGVTTKESLFTSAPVVEAVQFWQDLAFKHQVMPPEGVKTPKFEEGGAAMDASTPFGAAPKIRKKGIFKYVIAPFPWKVTNHVVDWTDMVMITNLSKNQDAAWELVKYLESKEGQVDYSKATLRPPTRVDAFDPYLDDMFKITSMKSKAELRHVLTGFLGNHTDNWAHYVIDARAYQVIQNKTRAKLLKNEAAAAPLLGDVKRQMDAQMHKTYEQHKDSRVVKDTLCI